MFLPDSRRRLNAQTQIHARKWGFASARDETSLRHVQHNYIYI